MAAVRPIGFRKLSKKRVSEVEKKPGGSNVRGRVAADGPFAGTQPNSFPIRTLEDGKSALKLAFNDPNPGRVRARVFARFPELKPKSEKKGNDFSRPITKRKRG